MTQLETDLRAALHERAARVHAPAGLLAADYHPRTRRLRPRVAIGGGLATAVCAIVAVLSPPRRIAPRMSRLPDYR